MDMKRSLSLREAQHTLRVLENGVLRNTFGPKMERE
jgi:hypothetical protein